MMDGSQSVRRDGSFNWEASVGDNSTTEWDCVDDDDISSTVLLLTVADSNRSLVVMQQP